MIDKRADILLDALKRVLSEKYSVELKDNKTEGNVFYCDFVSKINLSSNQFIEIEEFVRSKIDLDIFFIFTSISGISFNNGQRISGRIFKTKEELHEYLEEMKLAKQFDHKTMGLELEIFAQNQVAPGSAFWLKNGTIMLELIKNYIAKTMQSYERVLTPIFAKTQLWKQSGHYDMYRENMLILKVGDDEYAVKPMSCPLHTVLLKMRNIKKTDFPIRLAEFGHCHRNEASGALNGLLRARSITQDDAHIFCTENQIEAEVSEFCDLLLKIYKKFGFNNIETRLATRPEKFIGSIETWNRAEEFLASAIKKTGLHFIIQEGDGAFYGPKLEFHIKDNLGRLWQCGTVQLDFMMAERLDLSYRDGKEVNYPVIIHHAVLGSLERFIAILLEQSKGWLPIWLAPVQVSLLPISSDIDLSNIESIFKNNEIRYRVDSGDSLSNRVKRSCVDKIPIVVAIGNKELESKILAVRINGAKEIQMSIDQLIKIIMEDRP